MLRLIMAAACTVAFAAPAVAQTVAGSTSATFTNPTPGSTYSYSGGGSVFTYGTPDPTANQLSFAGTPFASTVGTAFKVGTLSYFNGTTVLGTNPTSVDLALKLTFTQPSIPATTSSFTLKLVTTPNTGTPEQNADYVYFPSSFSTTQLVIGGTTYNIALTGFGNVNGDGFLTSDTTQFHVLEGKSATADLFAKVTVSAAPEPGTWAMMILGFGFAGVALRRQVRRSEVKFDAKIKRIASGEALA